MNRKIAYIVTVALLAVLLMPAIVFAAENQPQTIQFTVIHTNDFHDFDPYALARKATIIKNIRAEQKNVLLMDAGDLSIRGPYHKIFFGELEMAAMNAMKYDVWELGNNEFKAHEDQAVTDEKNQ